MIQIDLIVHRWFRVHYGEVNANRASFNRELNLTFPEPMISEGLWVNAGDCVNISTTWVAGRSFARPCIPPTQTTGLRNQSPSRLASQRNISAGLHEIVHPIQDVIHQIWTQGITGNTIFLPVVLSVGKHTRGQRPCTAAISCHTDRGNAWLSKLTLTYSSKMLKAAFTDSGFLKVWIHSSGEQMIG